MKESESRVAEFFLAQRHAERWATPAHHVFGTQLVVVCRKGARPHETHASLFLLLLFEYIKCIGARVRKGARDREGRETPSGRVLELREEAEHRSQPGCGRELVRTLEDGACCNVDVGGGGLPAGHAYPDDCCALVAGGRYPAPPVQLHRLQRARARARARGSVRVWWQSHQHNAGMTGAVTVWRQPARVLASTGQCV